MKVDREIYKRYINLYHGLELFPNINSPNQRGNENGILFLSVFMMLAHANKCLDFYIIVDFLQICQNLQVIPGLFDRGANESNTIPVDQRRSQSHDNISGISAGTKLILDSIKGASFKNYAKDIANYGITHLFIYNNIKPRFVPPANPGNWSIWLYNGGYKFLSILFLPFQIINMLITTSKAREITSGKQVLFCELYPVKDTYIWKYIWKFYRWKMKKMYGIYWIAEIVNIYYNDYSHPIRTLAKELEL